MIVWRWISTEEVSKHPSAYRYYDNLLVWVLCIPVYYSRRVR